MIKAVIPVAGAGTMLRPHTHTQPKPLIPVAGKPILGHIIEGILEAGINDFVFIVGYMGEKIESYVRDNYEGKIGMEFVVQNPRKGLGHAIWMAREAISSSSEILISLGDTIFEADLSRFIKAPCSTIGVQEVEDPRNFGVAVVDADGRVVSAVEKPRIPKSNLGLVGLYKIREVDALIAGLDDLMKNGKPSVSGEYHLTEGLMKMVEGGVEIRVMEVEKWFDCGKKESLIETNRILLNRISDNQPAPEFPGCVILPPVFVAPGCTLENSIIGPNVAIAENAIIRNSIVRESILGAYSYLDSIILECSIIGNDALLRGNSQSVNIGDNTEIDFNS